MRPLWKIAFAVAVASATPTVVGQSLADVARQEEARRSTVRAPSKTFTNASLSAAADQAPGLAHRTAPPSLDAAPAARENSSAPTTASVPVAKPVAEVLDEKHWRDQAAAHRRQVASARKGLDALAGASHSDPREQALLEALRKQRQGALTQAEEAQRSFEKHAAAAQVPKAWIQ